MNGSIMTSICKWGNSLGLRLPAPVAEAAGVKAGTRVSVRLLDDGSLLVIPCSNAVAVRQGTVLPKVKPATTIW